MSYPICTQNLKEQPNFIQFLKLMVEMNECNVLCLATVFGNQVKLLPTGNWLTSFITHSLNYTTVGTKMAIAENRYRYQ
jgi:hypothetical protein